MLGGLKLLHTTVNTSSPKHTLHYSFLKNIIISDFT